MMLKQTLKHQILYAAFSLYFAFFMGWMQFHHGHDAQESLNEGKSQKTVEIHSVHRHSPQDCTPVIEHHILIEKTCLDCPLCAINWTFQQISHNNNNSTLHLFIAQLSNNDIILLNRPFSFYQLRAPPLAS
jgi:hypothetical protein